MVLCAEKNTGLTRQRKNDPGKICTFTELEVKKVCFQLSKELACMMYCEVHSVCLNNEILRREKMANHIRGNKDKCEQNEVGGGHLDSHHVSKSIKQKPNT